MKFTHNIIIAAVLLSCSMDVKAQVPDEVVEEGKVMMVDSTFSLPESSLSDEYLASLDSVMQAYEQQKKINEAAEAISKFQKIRLENEQKFHLKGTVPLLRGLMSSWTEHDFVSHPSVFEKKDNFHKYSLRQY